MNNLAVIFTVVCVSCIWFSKSSVEATGYQLLLQPDDFLEMQEDGNIMGMYLCSVVSANKYILIDILRRILHF